MSTALLVAIFGGGSLGGVIIAIANGAFFKRRTKAEAAELIQRAASGLTTSVTAELERMAKSHAQDRDDWRAERARWRDREDQWRATLQLHAAWDALVYARVLDARIEVPEPPPLLPPHT